MADPDDRVRTLAEAAGWMVDWSDAHGRPQQVPTHVLQALLGAMDLPSGSAAQLNDSLARLAEEAADRRPPALSLGDVGRPLPLRWLPRGSSAAWEIVLGDGSRHGGRTAVGDDGTPCLPPQPWGRHRLEVDGHSVPLAVAPRRCFGVADALPPEERTRRLWGIATQLYGLRGGPEGVPDDGALLGGSGDFGTLAQWCSAAGRRGAAALAINPVHAAFAASPGQYSPYAPSNRQFLNPLYADPVATFGREAVAAVVNRLQLGTLFDRMALGQQVDWTGVSAGRDAVLRALYAERHAVLGADALAALDAYGRAGGAALQHHAQFEALHADQSLQGRGGWRGWDDDIRTPQADGVARFAASHADEIGFHVFAQWLAARSLAAAQKAGRDAGMPIGLIGDLAVGADPNGSHAWSRQDEVFDGLEVGAPPDVFMPEGQGWGLGAFSPRGLARTGYGAYADMLRATMEHVGGVRIDHALGLQRLWLIPTGASPRDGAYLRYPIDDLMRLIKLASWEHRAIVVGENLGTVPDGFNARIEGDGMLGTSVLWFERDGARFRPPSAYSAHSMATTTTHDLPTVAGWWSETDIDWRVALNLYPDAAAEARERATRADDRAALAAALGTDSSGGSGPAVETGNPHIRSTGGAGDAGRPAAASPPPIDQAIGYVCASPAPLVMLPIEDLLGLTEQPNLPGTTAGHPNWCRRLPTTRHPIFEEPDVARRITIANDVRKERK